MSQRAPIESVPIPHDLRPLLQARLNGQSLSAWVAEAVVVEAIREHVISRNKGATLLGLEDYESREAFFERHLFLNEYTLEMWDQDCKAIEILEARRRS